MPLIKNGIKKIFGDAKEFELRTAILFRKIYPFLKIKDSGTEKGISGRGYRIDVRVYDSHDILIKNGECKYKTNGSINKSIIEPYLEICNDLEVSLIFITNRFPNLEAINFAHDNNVELFIEKNPIDIFAEYYFSRNHSREINSHIKIDFDDEGPNNVNIGFLISDKEITEFNGYFDGFYSSESIKLRRLFDISNDERAFKMKLKDMIESRELELLGHPNFFNRVKNCGWE